MKDLLLVMFTAMVFWSCGKEEVQILGTMSVMEDSPSYGTCSVVGERIFYGLMLNETGEVVAGCEYSSWAVDEKNNLVIMTKPDSTNVYVTKSGKVLTRISSIDEATGEEAQVYAQNGIFGLLAAISLIVLIITGAATSSSYGNKCSKIIMIISLLCFVFFICKTWTERNRYMGGKVIESATGKGLILDAKPILPCIFTTVFDYDGLVVGSTSDNKQVFADKSGNLYKNLDLATDEATTY